MNAEGKGGEKNQILSTGHPELKSRSRQWTTFNCQNPSQAQDKGVRSHIDALCQNLKPTSQFYKSKNNA